MVITHLKGDLGNQMCQYAVGRIIAEKKGYCLQLDDRDISDTNPSKDALFKCFPNLRLVKGQEITTNPILFGPDLQHLDLECAFNHSGLICLHGYWQKYYLYTPYVSQIRDWFSYDESTYEKPDNDDIIVHARLGASFERILEYEICPIKHIIDIINTLNYNKCVIVSERLDNPRLKEFGCIKNVIFRSKSRMDDFTFMKYAKRLIISQSSFSWWASFLGDQDKVYVPLKINGGPDFAWKQTPELFYDIDFVPTNDKYVKFYI